MRLSSPTFPSALCLPFWPWAKRLISTLVAGIFIITSVLGWAPPAQAQVGLAPFQPVTAINVANQGAAASPPFNTTYADGCDTDTFPGCGGSAVTLNFGAGLNRVITTVQVGGLTLNRVEVAGGRVEVRRNLAEPFNRDVLFYENFPLGAALPAQIDLQPNLADGVPSALLSSLVNRGVDNVFNNVQINIQDTRNNIERIDYILPDGVVVPAGAQNQEGFLVFDRVAPNGNDQFGIAAITSLDAAGLPNGYGPLVRVDDNPANWGTANQIEIETVVFRRENNPPEPIFRPSHRVAQQPASLQPVSLQRVGGIFFPISSLLPAPQSNQRIFGYSIVGADVLPGTDLVNWNTFPTNTGSGSNSGGLDIVAGGFALFQAPRPPVPGNLFLNKRITQLTAAGNAISFPGTINPDNNAGFPALEAADLGQGTVNVTNPVLEPADQIEYTLYINNTGETAVNNAQICDQIPPGTTFVPNAFAAGRGVQSLPPTNSRNPPANYNDAIVTYTNAADGDPATFFPAGSATLPPICGANQGNGGVVVTFPTVGPSQVGFVRFRTTVNPF